MDQRKPRQAASGERRGVNGVMNIAAAVALLASLALAISTYVWKQNQPPPIARGTMMSTPGLLEADEAFAIRDWEQAATSYRMVVEYDPYNAMAWHRLGYALHALQRLDEAIDAHRRASNFPQVRGVALYNLACALALQGKTEESLKALQHAIDAGFRSDHPVIDDPDFACLLNDTRFLELAKLATRHSPRSAPGGALADPALPADWQPPAEMVDS
ncbi:MAG: hypothetical protein J5I93_19810 [Pirellulaceae bacterium]|nr:hypothetical protein [Pirellulaceae bacterium]